MQEVLDAIERHLGRSLQIAQLDYYQVIGLEMYCGDTQRIREAIQKATNRWMQSETGKYPESAQIIAKLLKQAQIILLDPEKRMRYDAQLANLRRGQTESPSAVAEPTPDGNLLFPDSDPMAPFDFGSPSSSTSNPDVRCALLEQIQDPQTRLMQLEQLFPSLAELDRDSPADRDSPVDRDSLADRDSLDEEDEIDALQITAAMPSRSKGASLAQQISRRRKRNRVLVSLLLLLGSQAILGLAAFVYLRSPGDPSATKGRKIAQRQVDEGNAKTAITRTLPSIETRNQGSFSADEPRLMNRDNPSPAPPAQTETMLKEPAPTPEPPAPRDESAEWKKLMASARDALDRSDFKTFEKGIAQAVETAQTPLGEQQASRLDQLGQLHKIGTEAFEEAKKKTHDKTMSLRINNTEVNIVESTPEKLVIRANGKNQTYTWEKLPFGIANALIDMSLDSQAPTDVAARAVFFSLAPQFREAAAKNEILKKRIAGWFEKTVGKDPIRKDLPQALTDSFE
jgi:hypothetical protein